MNTKKAYDIWSDQYDSNNNKTRDLEAKAFRETLKNIHFDSCLEIGCGTGKNTEWLITKAKQVTAVDFSDEMLKRAKEKVVSEKVKFHQADVIKDWNFANQKYDLITFSLVLEHIENLDDIFRKASNVINSGGYIYIGELHPFKQYLGIKAKFETEKDEQTLICFNHNISDFINSAKQNNLAIVDVNEYFDGNDKKNIPRILTLLFKKK